MYVSFSSFLQFLALFLASAASTTPAQNDVTGCPGPGFRKFKGLFQFEARNPDELSFDVDDVVWVKPDQGDTEEGWLKAVFNGHEGLFPAAYAEELPNDHVTTTTSSAPAASTQVPFESSAPAADFAAMSNYANVEVTSSTQSGFGGADFQADFSAFR